MFKRFRNRRIDEKTRLAYQETFLNKDDLIWPVFVVGGSCVKVEIPSMKNVFHFSTDMLIKELQPLINQGLKSILIFGVPEQKRY